MKLLGSLSMSRGDLQFGRFLGNFSLKSVDEIPDREETETGAQNKTQKIASQVKKV